MRENNAEVVIILQKSEAFSPSARTLKSDWKKKKKCFKYKSDLNTKYVVFHPGRCLCPDRQDDIRPTLL